MKNSHKLMAMALVIVLTLGTAVSLAVNSNSDLTGRVKFTKEQSTKLKQEMTKRQATVTKEKVQRVVQPKTTQVKPVEIKNVKTLTTNNKTAKSEKGATARDEGQYNDYVGNGAIPDSTPVIETYIGSCNNPFGSPTCVVPGEYTTDDLAYNNDEIVYTMRVKNTSSTTPIYMDKVFLEYDTSGLNTAAWNTRLDWKIYDSSAPNTLLTRGHVANPNNPSGFVDFDWSYPGNLQNPINQPPVIMPGGTQTYIVTANIVDDSFGPNTSDYIEVRANDSMTFTPVVGGTLADAHNVNSHFIWHENNGNYYNEGYTDLMDMWGSIPSAYAQWRKRTWADPVVVIPVTLDIDNQLTPTSQTWTHSGMNIPWYNRTAMLLDITPSDPVTIPSYRLDFDYSLWTDGMAQMTGMAPITQAQCANPSTMQVIANAKVSGFEMHDVTSGDVLLSTVTGPSVVTGTAWYPGAGTYGDNYCNITGYIDLNFGGYVFPAGTSNINIIVGHNSINISPLEEFNFNTNNVPATTAALDASGSPLLVSQFTGPTFLYGMDITVDEDRLFIIEPTSSLAPYQMTAQQGESDVLLGVFFAQNKSRSQSVTLNELAIHDFLGVASAIEPDITNIRLYEWDYATNQPIGAPLASGLNMGASNMVTAQNLNLSFAPYGSGLPSNTHHLAIVGDLIPSIATNIGFDVNWEGGYNSDTDTSVDNNDLHFMVFGGGLTNPMTASPSPNVPFNFMFNQCDTSVGNPYINGCNTGPFNRIYNLDMTLGNLIDVVPAATSAPIINVEFGQNANPISYNDIIMPRNSNGSSMPSYFTNFGGHDYFCVNSVGECAAEVSLITVTPNIAADFILNGLTLTNPDGIMNYSQRFGNIWLVDMDNGTILTSSTLTDAGGAADGSINFSSFNTTIAALTSKTYGIFAEVNPILSASESGAIMNLFLQSANDISLVNNNTGIPVTSAQIQDLAFNGGAYQQFHVTRRTQPYISYNNGVISNVITGSVLQNPVYRFLVSADTNGDVEWDRVTFNVSNSAGMQVSDMTLYEFGNPNPLNPTAVNVVGGEATFDLPTPQIVPAGTSIEYILESNLTITNSTTSQAASFELTAADDTTLVTDTNANVQMLNPDFVWSDRSDPSHSLLTPDWTNGWLVSSFDVETVNIAFQGAGSSYMTRHDLLSTLFTAKGQPLQTGPSGCTDTTPAQEPVWYTAAILNMVQPNGPCNPNSYLNRAEASKLLATYSAFVSGNMNIISPPSPTFPDVALSMWYFDWIESLYNAMGNVYAIAGNNFGPSSPLSVLTGNTWINNLP